MRILYAHICGTTKTNNDFNHHYFFVKPLNNIANFNVFFLIVQVILCIVSLFLFTIQQEAFTIAVMGIILNLLLFIFQMVRCF